MLVGWLCQFAKPWMSRRPWLPTADRGTAEHVVRYLQQSGALVDADAA
jgi:hypothetical protein